MDTTKVKTSQPVANVPAVKRNVDEAQQTAAREKSSAPQKSPYDAPRKTTNSQGETIGARINYAA